MVTVSKAVFIKPEYGYGWAGIEKADWDEVPEPFNAAVVQSEETWFDKPVDTLRGIVIEPGHHFDGFSVFLSPRHDPWDGHVNVELSSNDGTKLSGFALLDMASFE